MGILDAPPVVPNPAGKDSFDSAAGYALMPWHAALGNSRNAPAKWLQVGDSLTEGYSATTKDKRWASLAADAVTTRFPTINGYTPRGGNFLPCYWWGQSQGNSVLTPPAVIIPGQGTPGTDSSFGFGGRGANLGANQGYTWTENCSSFDVCYIQGTATGTLGVTVDGGTEITFSTTGSLTGGKRWNSSAQGGLTLTPGSHTIKVRQISGGNCYVTGLMLYLGNETTGVQVVESGHFGWKVSDWTTSNTYRLQEMGTFQPHLVTIMLGANDYQNNVASATFKTQLQTLITQIRGVKTSQTSFVLIACHVRGDVTSPAEPWSNYVSAMKSISATDTGGIGGASGVSFIDLSRRLPAPGSNGAGDPLGIIASDRVHYSNFGSGMVANAVVAGISPR